MKALILAAALLATPAAATVYTFDESVVGDLPGRDQGGYDTGLTLQAGDILRLIGTTSTSDPEIAHFSIIPLSFHSLAKVRSRAVSGDVQVGWAFEQPGPIYDQGFFYVFAKTSQTPIPYIAEMEVLPGTVSAVPIPGGLILLASGLAFLMRPRRHQ